MDDDTARLVWQDGETSSAEQAVQTKHSKTFHYKGMFRSSEFTWLCGLWSAVYGCLDLDIHMIVEKENDVNDKNKRDDDDDDNDFPKQVFSNDKKSNDGKNNNEEDSFYSKYKKQYCHKLFPNNNRSENGHTSDTKIGKKPKYREGEANGIVTYKGNYRDGESIVFTATKLGIANDSVVVYQCLVANKGNCDPQRFVFTFPHTYEYTSQITGTYETANPFDQGTFTLHLQ